MSRTLLKISAGTLYDPANGIDGEVGDLWVEDGKIVVPPRDPEVRPTKTIDATGLVVMPGGVDMHCHIAGPKVNAARMLRPEDQRTAAPFHRRRLLHSGSLGATPSTLATGYKYAGLGYTTAFDAAVTPLAARHAHLELADTPCIDKGLYVLAGNNEYILQATGRREPARVRSFLAWLLGAAKAQAPKLVNPGGVEVWKQRAGGDVQGLDDVVDGFGVSPRQIIQTIAHAANDLQLPHPVHIHCNGLGLPGNWATTLETMRALDGLRGHLTHVQFHSYGGVDGDSTTMTSQVAPLVEYFNQHENLTVDVGQVMFGETTALTGDAPLGYFLQNLYKDKWYSFDTELESGCGVTPIQYKQQNLVHALQWAIGLEWFLLAGDPWRVALSTDHPNGGSFLAYPQVIALLMDRQLRREALQECPATLARLSQLGDLDREYSLSEIAIITRAAPARMLGLTNKGHLGAGANADVTIYSPNDDRRAMFALPRYVLKAGKVILDDGELLAAPTGGTLHVAPPYDTADEAHIRRWFEQYSSISFANYPVELEEVS